MVLIDFSFLLIDYAFKRRVVIVPKCEIFTNTQQTRVVCWVRKICLKVQIFLALLIRVYDSYSRVRLLAQTDTPQVHDYHS